MGGRVAAVGLLLAACARPAAEPPIAPGPETSLEIPRLDAGGAASGPGSGVRFGRVAPGVGARWSVEVHAESRAPDPQGGEQISGYESSFAVEVLAVSGLAPTRVRLTFATNRHTYQGRATETVIHGKTYVVDAGGPRVTTEGGAAAPEDEATRVLDVFPDLGTRARVDQVLPDDAMTIGDRRDELAAAILRIIHPRAWTLGAGEASLARVDGDDAVFAVKLDASSETGLRMELAGDARVRLRDASLSRLALEGGFEAPGGNAGRFTLRRVVTDR